MTKEGLAKAYHERIIERNPQAEAWNFSGAFIDGYDAGYDAAMNNRFDCDITTREKAKAYCRPILKDNHNKTYGFELYDIEDGFMAGYAEGFADVKNIYERRNTDKSRDEQIEKASIDFEMGYDPKMCAGEFFRDGAKWADANPYIEEVKNFDYQKEWDDHDYAAIEMHLPPKAAYQFGCDDMKQKAINSFCNVKCGVSRPCDKNHLCEDFCKFEKLLKA